MDKKGQRIEITIDRKEDGFKTTLNVCADDVMVMMVLARAIAKILVNSKNNPIEFSENLLKEYIDQLEENGSERKSYERAKNSARADA